MADTNMLDLAAKLRLLNRWRRGEDETLEQPAAADIGTWLDAAADALEAVEPLRQRAEQAEARVAELAAALRKCRPETLMLTPSLEMEPTELTHEIDAILARHAAGEPAQEACGGRCGDPLCNLSTEGEPMREPAKHPDTEGSK